MVATGVRLRQCRRQLQVLPDAWDGSLNTQRAFGNLGNFDVGPLLVTYSDIGMPGS